MIKTPSLLTAAFAALTFAATFCIATSIPGHAFVMGEDDRRALTDDEAWRFQSVGIIAAKWSLDDKMRRIGTGILIAPPGSKRDMVLTTAHNFMNHLTGRPRANEFFFLTNRGEKILILSAKLGQSFSSRGKINTAIAPRDWAIGILDRRISKRSGSLGIGIVDAKGIAAARQAHFPMFAVGYDPESRDFRISDGCVAHLLRPGTGLIHDCDTKRGWSGGPLILMMDGKPWVVGILTLQVTEKRKRRRNFHPRRHFNVATPTNTELQRLIRQIGKTGRLSGDNVLRFFDTQ
jgi:V8-like Glu-specific endopeptidase